MAQICEPFTKRQRDILAARDWHGEEEWKRMNSDYESLLAFRKTIKGKPDAFQKMQLEFNKGWIDFYKYILFHNMDRYDCTCRKCEEERQELAKMEFMPEYMVQKNMRRQRGL